MNPACPLTADICAHAIIAASQVYGIDLRRAASARNGFPRLPLTAAGYGLTTGAMLDAGRVCDVLGLPKNAIAERRAKGDARFFLAAQAAEVAVRAKWPAEARRSLERLAQFREAVQKRRPSTPPAKAEKSAPPTLRPVTAKPARTVLRKVPASPTELEPLRDRILTHLRDAPSTAPSLAILTDAKELAVCETLRVLEHEGLVVAGPVPEHGARHRQWLIAEDAAA